MALCEHRMVDHAATAAGEVLEMNLAMEAWSTDRCRDWIAGALIHLDEHLLVLDKPSGLLSVPAKPPGPADCLEARARAVYPETLLIHRLDGDTSGVMVFARTKTAQVHLNRQFQQRQVRKGYVARVWGEMASDAGRIDLPLICDWPNRPRQMVCHERGRPSVTEWRVTARGAGVTRVALTPLTGRSHQLRVHLLAIGHVILGDNFYAGPDALAAADRLQLHAETIGFRHPERDDWVEYTAPAPF